MTFRHEHPVLFSLGSVACVCVTIFAVIYSISLYSVEATKIKAEKDLKVAEIHEREETERAEERAQFWQKLVPWGNYEEEGSKK
jgi:hypothetical protein